MNPQNGYNKNNSAEVDAHYSKPENLKKLQEDEAKEKTNQRRKIKE